VFHVVPTNAIPIEVFTWREIKDGMTHFSQTKELLDIKFGSECELRAGYDEGPPRDPATWPVFCLLKKDHNKKVTGRFGDPNWNYPEIKLKSCNSSGTTLRPSALHNAWLSGTNGTCATQSELDALSPIDFNIWFRFESEDWSQSGGLKPSTGMIREEGKPGWTWFVYNSFIGNVDANGKYEQTKITLDLRHNTAFVNSMSDFWFWGSGGWRRQKEFEWLDFHRVIRARTATSSSTFFSAAMRIAPMARRLSVRYQTLQQSVSEISGSFAICLAFGGFVTIALEFISSQITGEKARKTAEDASYPSETQLAGAEELKGLQEEMGRIQQQLGIIQTPVEEAKPNPNPLMEQLSVGVRQCVPDAGASRLDTI